jgi:hypothetical protein
MDRIRNEFGGSLEVAHVSGHVVGKDESHIAKSTIKVLVSSIHLSLSFLLMCNL